MKNNEKLKKHHFWILAGVAPLLTVLAVADPLRGRRGRSRRRSPTRRPSSRPPRAPSRRGPRRSRTSKSNGSELDDKKLKLWDVNYKQQKDQFAWPGNNGYLKELEAKYPKFGEPMKTNRDEFNTFKSSEVYEKAYDDAANSIRPTTFATGNWRTGANGGPVFRYVSAWGDPYPTDKQIRLALEDLWVQRACPQPVNAVNEGATKFTPLPEPKGAKPNPLKRSFENRVWKRPRGPRDRAARPQGDRGEAGEQDRPAPGARHGRGHAATGEALRHRRAGRLRDPGELRPPRRHAGAQAGIPGGRRGAVGGQEEGDADRGEARPVSDQPRHSGGDRRAEDRRGHAGARRADRAGAAGAQPRNGVQGLPARGGS